MVVFERNVTMELVIGQLLDVCKVWDATQDVAGADVSTAGGSRAADRGLFVKTLADDSDGRRQ